MITIFIIYIYVADSYMNCKDWGKGLNNTYIDNNLEIHGCRIKFPRFCPYKLGEYVFDLTKWRGIECYKNKEDTKKKLLQFIEKSYINKNTKRIGFPLVNKNPDLLLHALELNNTLTKYIQNNLVNMDNTQLVEKVYKEYKPELIVDYKNNPYGEMIIDLKFISILDKLLVCKIFFNFFYLPFQSIFIWCLDERITPKNMHHQFQNYFLKIN